jgi:hypothetical protein
VLFSWKAFIYTVQQQPKQQEGAKPRAIILPPSSSSSSFSHSSTSSSSSGVLLAQNSSLQFLFGNFRIFNGRLPGILSPGFMIPGETNLRNIFA